MTGWCSGYSAKVIAPGNFCQLVREFESRPVHFLILFQNFEKLSSKIGVSSNLVWAQKTSYPTISAPSALGGCIKKIFKILNFEKKNLVKVEAKISKNLFFPKKWPQISFFVS